MTLRGRLQAVFLGGNAWTLAAEDGVTWQIIGPVPSELDGQLVVVEGRPAENQFSLNMLGSIFEANSVKAQQG